MNNKFYEQIDKALKSYEEGKSWHEKDIFWICDRVEWAWKWRKITQEQMEELANRSCEVMDNV